MISALFSRRSVALAISTLILAGCQIIPKSGPADGRAGPTPEPSATILPSDSSRHRVALLVPMTGRNGAIGQSLANAANMAILDTNANDLRITTYDTASNASAAARKAIADGNRLILGPLLANNIPAIQSQAASANIPIISFSNDSSAASRNVFIMGHIPEQSIDRAVAYARRNGSIRFGALVPNGDYGQRALGALSVALRKFGGALVSTERYSRGNTSAMSAAQRLHVRGGYDTVLIADGAPISEMAAGELRKDSASTLLIGTELWRGEGSLLRNATMQNAVFAAISDQRFGRFSSSYEKRFGRKPFRIASLGYDSVLLTLRMARDWRVGRPFPSNRLREETGFLGVDGAFRFQNSGVVERALAVMEVRDGTFATVDPAPASFDK